MVKIKRKLKRQIKKKLIKPRTKWWLWCPRPTEGGINLIKALGGKRIKAEGNRFKSKLHKVVINWGSNEIDLDGNAFILNTEDKVCVNKLTFFNRMTAAGVGKYLPAYTTDKKIAENWIKEKLTVVCRTILNGHSGKGIVIAAPKGKNRLVDAPLYTVYLPKDEEYRVHCIRGEDDIHVFYQQKKVKRANYVGKHNRYVRCYDNGYTYQHDNIELPGSVIQAAIEVFQASNLDFGAVDVIFSRRDNRACVLEINTAPGLEGKSVEAYAEAFKKYF